MHKTAVALAFAGLVAAQAAFVPLAYSAETGTPPAIMVTPGAIKAAADPGSSTIEILSIGNAGGDTLTWSIDETTARTMNPRAHFPDAPRPIQSSRRGSSSALAQPRDPALQSQGHRSERAVTSRRLLLGTSEVPAYSTVAFTREDYVTLNARTPGALATIVDPAPGDIYAQTFIDDDFRRHFFIATAGGHLQQGAYGYLDTKTGAVESLGVLTGVPTEGYWISATWDRSTGTVYAMFLPDVNQNQLYAIDVDTGIGTLVGSITGLSPEESIVLAIAMSPEGLLYGLEIADDVLVAIDKTTAQAAVIGPLGVDANFAQDMDFDASTGTLYWAGYHGDGDSHMYTIDVSTGLATPVAAIAGGAELLSFSVARPGPNCSLPSDVPWLSLDAESGSIPAGDPSQNVAVTLDAVDLSDGVYRATLCVRSNDPARALALVPIQFTVGLPTDGEADLLLNLVSVPASTHAGENVSLVALVENVGPSNATQVSVQLTLPGEFELVSARRIEGEGEWACVGLGSTVTCDLISGVLPVDGLAAALEVVVKVDAEAMDGPVQSNGLVASSNNDDPNSGNNSNSVTTVIVAGLSDVIFQNGFECASGYPGCPSQGMPGFYGSRATFLANVGPNRYQQAFDGISDGPLASPQSFSGNGFSYDVTALGPGSNSLYGGAGFITTDDTVDALRITVTGAPVTAIGGNFWPVDFDLLPTGTQVTLTLNDGTTRTYTASGSSSFGGFVTLAPITHITIEAPDGPDPNWAAIDNVIVGQR